MFESLHWDIHKDQSVSSRCVLGHTQGLVCVLSLCIGTYKRTSVYPLSIYWDIHKDQSVSSLSVHHYISNGRYAPQANDTVKHSNNNADTHTKHSNYTAFHNFNCLIVSITEQLEGTAASYYPLSNHHTSTPTYAYQRRPTYYAVGQKVETRTGAADVNE